MVAGEDHDQHLGVGEVLEAVRLAIDARQAEVGCRPPIGSVVRLDGSARARPLKSARPDNANIRRVHARIIMGNSQRRKAGVLRFKTATAASLPVAGELPRVFRDRSLRDPRLRGNPKAARAAA